MLIHENAPMLRPACIDWTDLEKGGTRFALGELREVSHCGANVIRLAIYINKVKYLNAPAVYVYIYLAADFVQNNAREADMTSQAYIGQGANLGVSAAEGTETLRESYAIYTACSKIMERYTPLQLVIGLVITYCCLSHFYYCW